MSQTQETMNEKHGLALDQAADTDRGAEIMARNRAGTLNAWRAQKTRLPYVHIGRLVRYRPENLADLMRCNTVRPE